MLKTTCYLIDTIHVKQDDLILYEPLVKRLSGTIHITERLYTWQMT